MFLFETKVLASFFYFKKFSFGFSCCFDVSCVGKTGGVLTLLWKKEINFEILQYSNYMIHGRVAVDISCPIEWVFTGLYSHPEPTSHLGTWDLIWSLKCVDNVPWLVVETLMGFCIWKRRVEV